MEKEYNVVTLESGKEYTEIYRLNDNNKTYVFLANLDDKDDFSIRRLGIRDGEEIIVGLDDEHELDKALRLFSREFLN